MILVSFFLSDDIKICYIFEYHSNENQAFRFFGTPGIIKSGDDRIIIAAVSFSHDDHEDWLLLQCPEAMTSATDQLFLTDLSLGNFV